jgi:hypothetical protein
VVIIFKDGDKPHPPDSIASKTNRTLWPNSRTRDTHTHTHNTPHTTHTTPDSFTSWLSQLSHECVVPVLWCDTEIMILIQVCPEAEAPDRNSTYYKYVGALTAKKPVPHTPLLASQLRCLLQGVGGAQEDNAQVRAAHA